MVWYGMVWYGMVWYGMVWYGMVWYGMVWYGMVWHSQFASTINSLIDKSESKGLKKILTGNCDFMVLFKCFHS